MSTPYPRFAVKLPIFGTYQEQRFEATLLLGEVSDMFRSSESVIFENEAMSVCASALKAVNTVKPSVTGWGGWQWWMFWDPVEQRERQIIDLRKDEPLLRRMRKKL